MDVSRDIPLLDPVAVARMQRVSRAAAVLAGGLAIAGLASHPLGVAWLRSFGRGVEIQPNAAAAILASSLALLLAGLSSRWARVGSRLLGAAVALFGMAVMLEHLTGVELGIGRVLVPALAQSSYVTSPGRPGPPASLSFVIVGAVILCLDDSRRRTARVAQGLAVGAMALALLGVVGHAYGVSLLYGRPAVTAIAFPTAVALLALNVGLLLARPDRGFVASLASAGAGSALARRLLVNVSLLPLLLGGLALSVTDDGEAGLAVALLVVVLSLLLVVLVLRDAVVIDRMEAAKIRAQEERAASREELARALRREQDARAHAESANRAKDEFLATLSHELRTPLNAILGWSGLLRDAGGDPERLARGVAVIERNGRTLAQLVSDLLDMSRIAAGRIEVEHADVELLATVDDAVEALRPAARAKGVALSRTAGPQLPRVVGDAARLRQVVWNLVSNAIKFTPPGGSVDVRLGSEAGGALLEVKDTGIGIARELLPAVFDPFVHAEGASVRRHGGLGLGLAITKQLVALHGGTIQAESDGPGQGSTFRVLLPEIARAPALAPVAAGARRELGGARVLVVDDEADSRDVLLQLLSSWGARAEGAASAREALDAVARERPDLVVSDIAMPGEDGFALVRELRRLEAARDEQPVPVAALTAFARPEDRQRALAAGFDAHLAKPVDPATLHATIAGLLRAAHGRGARGAGGPPGTPAPEAEKAVEGGEDALAAG